MIYGLTIFVGAFLLFAIQPLFGKYILPWFGGSPEVWTTCMLFFQVLLLAGYAYAHLITRFRPRLQAVVHIVLLAAALAALPIIPAPEWKPTSVDKPILQILLLLGVSIGLPYFVLSSTSPLVQRWFCRAGPRASPYRLYALSNAGSLIALLSYPFIVEPMLTRRAQAQIWSLGLACFAVLCGWCAIQLWKQSEVMKQENIEPAASDAGGASPSLGTCLLWFALPAGASVELLAVTNKLCLDLAVIPFLWVLPLCLYLVSFIICFHSERLYVRPVFLTIFIAGIVGVILARVYERDLTAAQQIWIYSSLLLSCCIVCHGELYRLKPHPAYLTRYYLMIGAGGAAGGVFVAVLAPLLFKSYRELHVGLLACCLFVLLADRSPALGRGIRRWVWTALVLVVGTAAMLLPGERGGTYKTAVFNSRNFFGVLTIWEVDPNIPLFHMFVMQHGTTFHGLQFTHPDKRLLPTAYYGEESGVGLALRFFPRQQNRRIGIVGLGVGTIAAYGKEGDYMRFYEINPEVNRLAQTNFAYLATCPAAVDVVVGDARLSMENEPSQQFDVLVLDAFTSNAIPVHLLTREAFDMYLGHLKPDGLIAVHVSSTHLELETVVWKLAEHLGLNAMWIEGVEDEEKGVYGSDWVLLTNNEEFLSRKEIHSAAGGAPTNFERIRLWTDDYVNLFRILK